MRNNQEGGSGDQRDVPAVGAAAALLLAAAVNANIDRLNCYLYINQKLRERKEYHLYRLALARTSLRRIFRRGKKKGAGLFRPSRVPSVHTVSTTLHERMANQLL